MGYRLAGCEVVAAVDSDPVMMKHYQMNLGTRTRYFESLVQKLVNSSELDPYVGIDILDGSPPCSPFSHLGKRDDYWGQNRHFREGGEVQVLSDLFFEYMRMVDRIRPKVAIAENVRAMSFGKARGYIKMVLERFRALGYMPQLFRINAADCGVPQYRERLFFCAIRKELYETPLVIKLPGVHVSAEQAFAGLAPPSPEEMVQLKPTREALAFWTYTEPGKSFLAARVKATGKKIGYARRRLKGSIPCHTLTGSADDFYHWSECRRLTYREWLRLGAFPDDYKATNRNSGCYVVGMSVPPKLMFTVAQAVCRQWFKT